VVASRANQECIQADLATLQATNEELHRSNEELRRDLQNQAGEREEEDQEPATQLTIKNNFTSQFKSFLVNLKHNLHIQR